VAQGTFYYYFESKAEILLAIFDKYAQQGICELKEILIRKDLNMIEKYNMGLELQLKAIRNNKKLSSELHTEENAGIHQKTLINTICLYTPIYEELMKQGVEALV